MKYYKQCKMKDGRELILRNCEREDGREVKEVFDRTHAETDFLLSYPDENSFDAEGEEQFLEEMAESASGIEIAAVADGKIVGTAGISEVGKKYKVRHRAEFGISILKEYWGLGIGRALMNACIECAREAGFVQLELDVVGDNEKALTMYKSAGFVEIGRNPKGFNSRVSGYQELVLMALEL